MKEGVIILFYLMLSLLSLQQQSAYEVSEDRLYSYVVDPVEASIRFYWRDQDGKKYKTFEQVILDEEEKCREVRFLCNGGMFNVDFSPQGLYVEEGEQLSRMIKKQKGYGNFFMQPNGIFYVKDSGEAIVCKTQDYLSDSVRYATQSGPMLLIDGAYHPKFRKGSSNLHIRNGVGILPDGKVLFAMSKKKINFYDLATFFKQRGCKNALYLDGFVSRTYLPEEEVEQMDGRFGVMIGVVKEM